LKCFYEDVSNALSSSGTRSPDLKLQEAQRGIKDIGKRTMNKTYFLPIAIIPVIKWSRGYNFGRHLSIVVWDV
jgi:hypothetical protein